MDDADFYELVLNFQHYFFRLQVHPVYGVASEQESFERFLRTGVREISPDSAPLVRMRQHRSLGRLSQRVYLVTPPLNDYQRYVFINYRLMAEAGEDLRVLDLSRRQNPGLPDYDFILLDDKTVMRLHYEKQGGAYLGTELVTDADLTAYGQYRKLALANSVPFLEYEKTLDT